MKNNTNYFSHDCNARDDEKIMLLRAEYWREGYGIWWLMIEKLSEATGYKLLLTNKLVISKLYLANINIINYLFDLWLLVEEWEYMYSPSLLHRMQLKIDKKIRQSEWWKKAMVSRWKNNTESQSDKLLITSKVKQSKVKEIKEDNKQYIGDFESTLLEFQNMRKTIKKPMTDRAVELLKKELEKLAPWDKDMQIVIMNKSIVNCRQWVFALKDDDIQSIKHPTIKEYEQQRVRVLERWQADDTENKKLFNCFHAMKDAIWEEKALKIRKETRKLQ